MKEHGYYVTSTGDLKYLKNGYSYNGWEALRMKQS